MADEAALHPDPYLRLIEHLEELPRIAAKVQEIAQVIRNLQARPSDNNKIDCPDVPSDEDLARRHL